MPTADIRAVGVEALDDILALATEGMKDTRYGSVGIDRERVARYIQTIPALFSLVAYVEEEAAGLLVGNVYPHPFANMHCATNLAFYVKPDYRGQGIAEALIRRFEELAFAGGAHEIVLCSTSGYKPRATMRLYERLGYVTIGALAVKHAGDYYGR